MEQRTRFALAYKDGLFSIAELCSRFNVSRKTGYKWIRHYEESGLPGLEERSRRPHFCPHQTPPGVEELVVECRKKHPHWGPEKLLDQVRHVQVEEAPALYQPDPGTSSGSPSKKWRMESGVSTSTTSCLPHSMNATLSSKLPYLVQDPALDLLQKCYLCTRFNLLPISPAHSGERISLAPLLLPTTLRLPDLEGDQLRAW